ncbi:hypothetical protein [Acetobacter senegalensis]|uniref:hypothetical protein n=1 Tax=Acetobacter senegalensis TaxID=446692 RepID=UPI002653CDC5|nr:hypothetical protein [Acetobacter senegalensis]MDN7352593.1 hypothetical protein [Acetobacter senegalensis]
MTSLILFNGEDIVLHFQKGISDFIIVTFESVNKEGEAESGFFGKKPANKNGYNIIGITSKKPNWYLSSEMETALSLCSNITRDYSIIICFGYSMGAYGSIKYSRSIGATSTLALAPQYSILSSDCPLNDFLSGFSAFAQPGMAITSADIGGRIYIAHDPCEYVDTVHANLIAAQAEHAVHLFPFFGAGHQIIDYVKGSENFQKMMLSLAGKTKTDIVNVVSLIRRRQGSYLSKLFGASCQKHPYLTAKALLSKTFTEIDSVDEIYTNRTMQSALTGALLRQGYLFEASALIISNYLYAREGRYDNAFSDRDIRPSIHWMLTYHDWYLGYSVKNKAFARCDPFCPQGDALPVVIEQSAQTAYLMIDLLGRPTYLAPRSGRIVLIGNRSEEAQFEVVRHHEGTIFLRSPLGVIGARPDGSVYADSPNMMDWEKMLIVSP